MADSKDKDAPTVAAPGHLESSQIIRTGAQDTPAPREASSNPHRQRLLILDGQVWELDDSYEADTCVEVLTEGHAFQIGPLRLLSSDISAEADAADAAEGPLVEIFDTSGELVAQGWIPAAAQTMDEEDPDADESVGTEGAAPTDQEPAEAGDANAAEGDQKADRAEVVWPIKSRVWDDVEPSDVDTRIVIATSHGIVTPSGEVVSKPFGRLEDVGLFVCKYKRWSIRAAAAHEKFNPQRVQIWITPDALEAIGFDFDNLKIEELDKKVEDAFGGKVTYSRSGWFTVAFADIPPDENGREAELMLLPFVHVDPSKSRPDDRGLAGIEGTDTFLPADEYEMAHTLGDRMAFQFNNLEEAMPAPRWSQVGAGMLMRTIKKMEGNKWEEMKPSPLPVDIGSKGKLPSAWWVDSWTPAVVEEPEDGTEMVLVELDQQCAYLPSMTGLQIGYGKPFWDNDPSKSMFTLGEDSELVPSAVSYVTIPKGRDIDGLDERLPLPVPGMQWDKAVSLWLPTVEVLNLQQPVAKGGAGLTRDRLNIDRSYVWPEQHTLLRGFGEAIRDALKEARALGRKDYQDIGKAIYTSTAGRMASVNDSSYKFPYLGLINPYAYASIEALTRHRAMKYAIRIAKEKKIYPRYLHVDAFYYVIPAKKDPGFLEDKLNADGTRNNGSYRVKSIRPYEKPKQQRKRAVAAKRARRD
ncbi:hypothetical protein [Mycobacteroides abscessus]|uniref:hypothetical protein n=1 Tax=Mycobacteroides abscessus TaxID=36809 RepID=UPI0009A59B44|nr:hypothetical protein [Mycobacteroides abscessus]SKK29613.1 Uncharacterised protein [Mycobacteroides abscessus subsp. abscessus]